MSCSPFTLGSRRPRNDGGGALALFLPCAAAVTLGVGARAPLTARETFVCYGHRATRRHLADPCTSPATLRSEWYGEIDVGTPATAFSVVLDTGSADLILAETNCNGCSSSTPGYQPSTSSTSSTSSQDFSIQYGSGSATGSSSSAHCVDCRGPD